MLKTAFLNLLLRLAASASRLVLVIALARFLPVEDIGRFGLVVASIQMLVYAAGLEFHLFATRALLEVHESGWPALLRGQVAVYAAAYLLVIPASSFVFVTGWLEPRLAVWFYALLLTEHACQELQRLLVTRGRPLRSNVVLFARTGAWGIAIIVVMFVWPATRDLRLVWAGWLAGAAVGVGIGVTGLRDLDWSAVRRTPIDRAWIRRGLKVSLPYLVSNLAFLGITTIDRYLLAALGSPAAVGVYVFFFGITNSVITLTESGVVNIVIPDLIRAGRLGDRRAMSRLVRGVLTLVPLLSVAMVVFIGPLLTLVGKDVYIENLTVCWVLLAGVVVATFGLIPHVALYARRKDGPILFSSFAGLLVAACAHLVLIPRYGALGAAMATLIAMLVLSGIKTIAILRSSDPQSVAQIAG